MDEVHVPSDSQARLLRIARWTLEDVVQGGQRQVEQIGDPCLQSREYGAFVSLHRGDELRGCIGTCTPSTPLYQTVVDMTQAAASRDSRGRSSHQQRPRFTSGCCRRFPGSSCSALTRTGKAWSSHCTRREARSSSSSGGGAISVGHKNFSGANLPQSWIAKECLERAQHVGVQL